VIYLAGGGSADDERAVWSAALAGRRSVLYWPFATPVSAHADGLYSLEGALSAHGRFDVEMWSTLGDADLDALSGYDLLFVGGGNTYALLAEIRRHDWLAPLGAWVRGGGAYFGDSAGAVLAGADVEVAGRVGDPNDVGLTDTAALDLLGGRDVWPHLTDDDVRRARDWATTTGRTVLGVTERGGLTVADGVIRCVGPDPVRLLGPAIDRTLVPGAEIDV